MILYTEFDTKYLDPKEMSIWIYRLMYSRASGMNGDSLEALGIGSGSHFKHLQLQGINLFHFLQFSFTKKYATLSPKKL